MKRFAALVVIIVLTTLGLAAFTATYDGADGSQLSYSELWGIPLLAIHSSDVGFGSPSIISLGLPGIAVLSVGVGGVGLVSIGAIGGGVLFGIGQLGTGLLSIGQLSIGGLVGIGQLATGWASLGQLALGVRARGQGYKWRKGGEFFKSMHAELEELLRLDFVEDRLFARKR